MTFLSFIYLPLIYIYIYINGKYIYILTDLNNILFYDILIYRNNIIVLLLNSFLFIR